MKPAAKAGNTARRREGQLPVEGGAKARPAAPKVRKVQKAPLLSGGNPRIAKADGAAPVQAYIAGMPGWKRDLGKRLDVPIGFLGPRP